jgi:aryl-alcohol dehydrogenase-like predicted oxidoreductase
LDGCLKRLQTDHVELLYLHNPEPHATWDELWGSFQQAVSCGKVDYVGCSNFAGYQIAMAQAAAKERHFLGLVCDQSKYNLIARLPELELMPACRALGLGFLAWGPLQGGMLSGSLLRQIEGGQRSSKYVGNLPPERVEQLTKYAALCHDFGMTEAEVSLAWLLSRPGLTAPLVGPRTVAQLEDSLRAAELRLPEELVQQVEILFPGPIAEAPMAYSKS